MYKELGMFLPRKALYHLSNRKGGVIMTMKESKTYLHGKYAQHGLKQGQVAMDVLNVDPATLSRYMCGTIQWPLWAIQAMMDYFSIPSEDVYSVFISPYVRK